MIALPWGIESYCLQIQVLDSSKATGEGKTGIAYNSEGLIVATLADNESAPVVYDAASSKIEAIAAIGTYVAPTSSKCRFGEISSTYMPGAYQIQLPNARLAVAGARELIVKAFGAANMAQTDYRIRFTTPAYYADIFFNRSGTQDEYTVCWFHDGVLETTGITNASIKATLRADASVLFTTSMVQVGSTGVFKYDATGANVLDPGEAYIIEVTATIDGATRTWRRSIGRDN